MRPTSKSQGGDVTKKLLFHSSLFLFAVCGLYFYLNLEVLLNTVLVQLYASGMDALVGEYSSLVDDVELLGRLVSGFGIALAIVLSIPKRFVNGMTLGKLGEVKTRLMLLLLVWILAVPGLRFVVDDVVFSSSSDTKLAAVRSLLFKEALDRDLVAFANAESMNAIMDDSQRRKLLVALLPSLALVSDHVDATIAQETENIVLTIMERDQKALFEQQVFPRYMQARRQYDQEWELYQTAKQEAQLVGEDITDPVVFQGEYAKLQRGIDQLLANDWVLYHEGMENALRDIEGIAKRYANIYRSYIQQVLDNNCYDECLDKSRARWHEHLQQEIDNGNMSGLRLLAVEDEPWIFHEYDTSTNEAFRNKLKEARENYLAYRFPFESGLSQGEFMAQPEVQALVVNFVRDQGYPVPDYWQRTDARTIRGFSLDKATQAMDDVWATYAEKSVLKFEERDLDKLAYAQHPKIKQMWQQMLETNYFPGFQRDTGRNELYEYWVNTLRSNDINFVRMLTDSTAKTAFVPGGMFYDIGVDAVRLSYIPPLAITATLLAAISLLLQFSRLLGLYHRNAAYAYLASLGLGFVFVVLPQFNKEDSFAMALKEFGQQSVTMSSSDLMLAKSLGSVIDAEEWLLKATAFRSLPNLVSSFKSGEAEDKLWFQLFQGVTALDTWLVGLFAGEDVAIDEFDLNIAVIKRDARMGLYAGVNYDAKGQVNGLALPNIMEKENAQFLARQQWLFEPNVRQSAELLAKQLENAPQDSVMPPLRAQELRTQLESQALDWMQDSNDKLGHIYDAYQNGGRNLIFVQRTMKQEYECLQLPKLSLASLLQMSRQESVTGEASFECYGDMRQTKL